MSGQASADYVALLALVAVVVLAGAGVVVSGRDLPVAVAGALRHGVCVVSGAICSPGEARRAGLDPCVTGGRENSEALSARVLVVRLENGNVLQVEELSDGTSTVSFVDGWKGGAELGAGLGATFAARGAGGAGLGLGFASGRTWRFSSAAARDAFLARFAGKETLTGEAVGLADGLLDHVGLSVRDDVHRPAPLATFVEGGSWADLGTSAEVLGAGVGAGIEGGQVLGHKREGERTTWYVKVSGSGTGRLGAVVASARGRLTGDLVLELERDGTRFTQLRVRAAAAWATGAVPPFGPAVDLDGIAERLGRLPDDRRGASGRGGLLGELTIGLDLRDPRNRDAVLAAFGSATEARRLQGLAELGRRLDADGDVDLRAYRTQDRRVAGQQIDLVKVGGGYERAERTRVLSGAWSLRDGGRLRVREDCVLPA